MTERLDRIERILENLAANQAEERDRRLELREDLELLHQRQQQTQEQVESFQATQQRTQQQIDSLQIAQQRTQQQIDANFQAIAELREQLQNSTTDLINLITTQATQAAQDRAEMRRMIEAMYGDRSNGHG